MDINKYNYLHLHKYIYFCINIYICVCNTAKSAHQHSIYAWRFHI